MKIQILSDLHLEVSKFTVPRTDADLLVLAGDIGVGMKGIEWARDLLSRVDGHILYVPGNHEFYHHDISEVRQALRKFCAPPVGWTGDDSLQRLHFLDDSEVIIGGVRFLGSTLWTDFRLFGQAERENCMIDGGRALNDFRLIRNGEWNFSVQDSYELHEQSVKWLQMKLEREPFAGDTVVVTHHAPTWQSVVPRYQRDLVSACFASRLDHLMGRAALWIHGHAHDSLNYECEGTRVVCNPRGYSRYEHDQENDKFNPRLVVEVLDGQARVLDVPAALQPDPEPEPRPLMSARQRDVAIHALDHLEVHEHGGVQFVDLWALPPAARSHVQDIVNTHDQALRGLPQGLAVLPFAQEDLGWLVERLILRGPVTKRTPRRRLYGLFREAAGSGHGYEKDGQ